jgi:hypothetical protein
MLYPLYCVIGWFRALRYTGWSLAAKYSGA